MLAFKVANCVKKPLYCVNLQYHISNQRLGKASNQLFAKAFIQVKTASSLPTTQCWAGRGQDMVELIFIRRTQVDVTI